MSDEIKDMGTNLPTDENTVTVSGADTEHGTQMATDTESDEVTAEVLAEDNTDATEAEGGEGEEPTSLVDGGEMPDEAGDSYADDDLDGAIPDGEVTTVFAVDDECVVDVGRAEGYAVILAMLGIVVDLGGVQKRLGRDAALVQAHTAKCSFLDHKGLEACVACAFGGIVARRAATQNNQIIHVRHLSYFANRTSMFSRA